MRIKQSRYRQQNPVPQVSAGLRQEAASNEAAQRAYYNSPWEKRAFASGALAFKLAHDEIISLRVEAGKPLEIGRLVTELLGRAKEVLESLKLTD